MLEEKQLPGGCEQDDTCPADSLYQNYLDHAKMTNQRSQRLTKTQFGIALRKLMPLTKAGRPKIKRFRTACKTYADAEPQWAYAYALPPLSECRERFEDLLGQPYEWEEPPDGSSLIHEFEEQEVVENWDKEQLSHQPAAHDSAAYEQNDIPYP
jgi:hypothetical protein